MLGDPDTDVAGFPVAALRGWGGVTTQKLQVRL
jgi:hypothetical protein